MLAYLRSAFPPTETRRAKQNNFLFNSLIFRATLFLLKGIENCFALMFGLMPNCGNGGVYPPAGGLRLGRGGIPVGMTLQPPPSATPSLACPSVADRRRRGLPFFSAKLEAVPISLARRLNMNLAYQKIII